jgi:hypothetical protein
MIILFGSSFILIFGTAYFNSRLLLRSNQSARDQVDVSTAWQVNTAQYQLASATKVGREKRKKE